MKLVIDIDDSLYESIHKDFIINSSVRSGKTFLQTICKAILFGTPLPKNHGDLIDREEIKKRAMFVSGDNLAIEGVEVVTVGMIDNAPTIIPATKGDNKNETGD